MEQLNVALAASFRTADILFVDDASTDPLPEAVHQKKAWNALIDLRVLRLRSNLGHQRAIAVGLAHLYATSEISTVVVMDGDGEDKAEDVPRLLDRFKREAGRKLIFALRLRRSEGFVFTFFYHFYRLIHWLLTGIPVRFGNFSVISRDSMARLVVSADLWNHYAASVLRSRMPFDVLPTERGERIAGRSKMNFVAQVSHGLSALSVFGELIGVRLLIGCFVLCLLFLIGGVSVVSLGHELHLPGWAAITVCFWSC